MTFLKRPLIPAKAGTQFFGRSDGAIGSTIFIPDAGALRPHGVPAFAGMSGGVG